MPKRPKPIVLTVLDGWGYRAETKGNAIALARKPNYDRLLKDFPNTLIHTSGPYVGLPEGQMGNSEVGHMNMGAGRIIHMDITRVDVMIANGEFFKQPLLAEAMERGRARNLHLLGLLSDGGVHSHLQHLFALLRMAREQHVERVFVHCFTDGRDTPPHSGVEYIQQLQQKIREIGCGQIASLTGRYYAMDRDNRWERVERAYRAVVHGDAPVKTADPVEAIRRSYERGVTDDFVEPIVIAASASPSGPPAGPIRDDDAVIFFNFRADRARQLTRAIAEPGFKEFADAKRPTNLCYVAMTQYDKAWPWLRYVIAPEKIAHILVPSPKVPTYDLKPEMSAAGIADNIVKAVEKGDFDAIVMNFANADMVGHSGKLEAAIKAVETVDECLGRIRQALQPRGGAWIVTADHGNAETMIDPVTGGPHTYHTTNPVPLIIATEDGNIPLAPGGSLRDIAPTMLGVLGLPVPEEMSGHDLRGM